jgi:Putative transposase
VLRYLARYTHRVAISNRRLIACDEKGVTFKWKDYRAQGRERYKVMTLANHEFIRRFLIHVPPVATPPVDCCAGGNGRNHEVCGVAGNQAKQLSSGMNPWCEGVGHSHEF